MVPLLGFLLLSGSPYAGYNTVTALKGQNILAQGLRSGLRNTKSSLPCKGKTK